MDPSSLFIDEEYSFDIQRDLIGTEEVMKNESLGPNGALLFCMEYLEREVDSFCKEILSLSSEDENPFFIFDLPGQAELITCHSSLQKILSHMEKVYNFRIVVLHLIDSTGCQDSGRFIASLISALQTMLMLERPQLNILSKFDLIEQGGPLPLRIEDYLLLSNLSLLALPKDKLSNALIELIEDLGLLSMIPIAIEDVICISFLVGEMDKANGFVYLDKEGGNEAITGISVKEGLLDSLIEHCKQKYTKVLTDSDLDLLYGDD